MYTLDSIEEATGFTNGKIYRHHKVMTRRDCEQLKSGKNGSGRLCPSLLFPLPCSKPLVYILKANHQGLKMTTKFQLLKY